MDYATNEKVRKAAAVNRVCMWEIAARLGISEPQFYRWLRKEFDQQRQQQVLRIIKEIAAEKKKGGNK
ncbi:MAG: helix-turn-helix domain-containing protein [Lachnospiraceae bacterium]|nr:helix-turn-helix domain-containing protein [Lachnospiraceae bacterium]